MCTYMSFSCVCEDVTQHTPASPQESLIGEQTGDAGLGERASGRDAEEGRRRGVGAVLMQLTQTLWKILLQTVMFSKPAITPASC